MTHEEKINYMRIATGIAGFGIKNEHLDLLVSIYELVLEKKGKTDMISCLNVEDEVKKREKVRHTSELLKKIDAGESELKQPTT